MLSRTHRKLVLVESDINQYRVVFDNVPYFGTLEPGFAERHHMFSKNELSSRLGFVKQQNAWKLIGIVAGTVFLVLGALMAMYGSPDTFGRGGFVVLVFVSLGAGITASATRYMSYEATAFQLGSENFPDKKILTFFKFSQDDYGVWISPSDGIPAIIGDPHEYRFF